MRRRGDAAIPEEALAMMGHPTGPPRRPLPRATEEDIKELKRILPDLSLM
jgi:dihydrodipicolinate synthase/N-acetylneuraminate lyase